MWSALSTPLCFQPTNPLLRPPRTGTLLFHWMGGRLKDVCIHVFDVSDDVGRFCKMVLCLCASVLRVYQAHIGGRDMSSRPCTFQSGSITWPVWLCQSLDLRSTPSALCRVSLAVLEKFMWCCLLMDICHRVCRRHVVSAGVFGWMVCVTWPHDPGSHSRTQNCQQIYCCCEYEVSQSRWE